METNKIWPCIRCTIDEFEEQIYKELSALGYAMCFKWNDTDNMVVTNFNGIDGNVSSIKETFVNSVIHHRNLCATIPEFLEAAKDVAIREGWFKPEQLEKPKEETPTLAEEAEVEKWPCVRCSASTFRKKIAPRLKEWGYILGQIDKDFGCFDTIITNSFNIGNYVINGPENAATNFGRYLCPTIPVFLADTKALAVRRGWFQEKEVVTERETTTEESDYIIKDLGVDAMGNKIGFSKIKTGAPRTNSEEPAEKSDFIDWEKRRYEIARACLVALDSNNNPQICDADSAMRARWAVADADALIQELKKNKRDED